MARTTPRTRHKVSPALIRGLSPVVRYSAGRQAYVLRGVGGRFGPVLVPKEAEQAEERKAVPR